MTDSVLEALWKRVLDDWDDERGHDAFVEYCRQTNRLLEAAVRYRGMAGDHTRGPAAQKRLQGLSTLALAELEIERTPDRRGYTTLARILLILLFVAGSVALLFAFNR
jgi:hypothetical protein